MDLTIGIVAYNAVDKLRVCLSSIATQTDCGEIETVVVDNASTEPVSPMVADEFGWVRLVTSPTNLGFAGGTNQAFSGASGRLLLWLNPDTELPTSDTLRRLIDRFDGQAELGALGCRLVYPDGSEQPHRGRFPTVGAELRDLCHWRHEPALPALADASLVGVDYVSGACLLTSAAVWRQVGELDTGYFMYLEDVDWCRRAQSHGWRCVIDRSVTVVHAEGACYGGRLFLRREHYWRSLVRYVRRHDGLAAAAALRGGLALTAGAKLVGSLADRSAARADRRRLLKAQLRLALAGK